MRYKIDQHDYDVRIGQSQRFLKAATSEVPDLPRGRSMQRWPSLLRRMAKDLEEKAEIQHCRRDAT